MATTSVVLHLGGNRKLVSVAATVAEAQRMMLYAVNKAGSAEQLYKSMMGIPHVS